MSCGLVLYLHLYLFWKYGSNACGLPEDANLAEPSTILKLYGVAMYFAKLQWLHTGKV